MNARDLPQPKNSHAADDSKPPRGSEVKDFIRYARKLARRFRVTDGSRFRLRDVDPGDTLDLRAADKPRAQVALARGVEVLATLQDRLYAEGRWAMLLIFQAMDAGGKDSAIKHVMSGVNPQGCQVFSFKAPTTVDLSHDFLWRCTQCLPERGRIGIFNRSYYEETLVVRVHPELLERQRLPDRLVTKRIWDERFEDIRHYEHFLTRNGVAIRKFFLHVSKREQKKRFLERLDDPDKAWKYSAADLQERAHWKEYMAAYEDTIRHTATRDAPWYVVPADNKWFTRVVVAAAIIDALDSLDLQYPKLDPAQMKALAATRRALAAKR